MDKVEPTPARLHEELPWEADARDALDRLVEQEPVLVRISAAKRLRDAAEREARRNTETTVSAGRVEAARKALLEGVLA